MARHQNLLIAWLDGKMDLSIIDPNGTLHNWASPAPVKHIDEFAPALKEGLKALQCTPKEASLLLEDASMSYHTIDAPKLNKRLLDSFLAFKAQELKQFTGKAATASLRVPESKEAASKKPGKLILSLADNGTLAKLQSICNGLNLHLKEVVPSMELMARLPSNQNIPENSLTMQVLLLAEYVLISVIGSDGAPWVMRKTKLHPSNQLEHLEKDLNRTILYVKQHHGVGVDRIFLNQLDEQEREKVSQGLGLPVERSSNLSGPYSGSFTLKSPHRGAASLNFIRHKPIGAKNLQGAKQLLRYWSGIQVAAACLVMLLLWNVGSKSQNRIQSIEGQIDKMTELKAKLHWLDNHLDQKRFWTQTIHEALEGGMPLWFLAYMSQALPSEATLVGFSIQHDKESWHFNLEGQLNTTEGIQPADRANILKRTTQTFQENLKHGPFQAAIHTWGQDVLKKNPGTQSAAMPAPNSGNTIHPLRGAQRFANNASQRLGGYDQTRFEIKGSIQ